MHRGPFLHISLALLRTIHGSAQAKNDSVHIHIAQSKTLPQLLARENAELSAGPQSRRFFHNLRLKHGGREGVRGGAVFLSHLND